MRRATERERIELGLAAMSMLLFVVTLIWKDWIEIVFRVDPDHGNGSLEWLILAITGLAAIAFAILAGTERRRSRAGAVAVFGPVVTAGWSERRSKR